MAALSTFLVVATIACSALANVMPMNTVADVKMQEGNLLKCWEPIDPTNPSAGYTLSKAIYTMCQYMPTAHSYDEFYVNGAEETSDDFTNVHRIFADTVEGHAVLNLCLQEGFSFSGPHRASQTSLRCYCQRSGCNIPKPFLEFLDFNKKVIPAITAH
ncbi:unnamed protein product [Caenorhabditis brenneri]